MKASCKISVSILLKLRCFHKQLDGRKRWQSLEECQGWVLWVSRRLFSCISSSGMQVARLKSSQSFLRTLIQAKNDPSKAVDRRERKNERPTIPPVDVSSSSRSLISTLFYLGSILSLDRSRRSWEMQAQYHHDQTQFRKKRCGEKRSYQKTPVEHRKKNCAKHSLWKECRSNNAAGQ